jgi:hypothetical protein
LKTSGKALEEMDAIFGKDEMGSLDTSHPTVLAVEADKSESSA